MTSLSISIVMLCAITWFAMSLARHLYGKKAGLNAFLICISYFMVVILGHYLTLDMLFSSLMFFGIGCLIFAQSQRRDVPHVHRWMLAAWIALALATISKGPFAFVLPATTVAVYTLWQRDWGLLPSLHLGKGLLLYFLVTAAWFVAVSTVNAEPASFFFTHEHVQRYTAEIFSREGSIYYLIPILIAAVCPWIWVSLGTLFKPLFSWRPAAAGSFHPERFMWVFAITTLTFFAFFQSRLPGYILPIIPVLAVMGGERLATQGFRVADRWTLTAIGLVTFVIALNLGYFVTDNHPAKLRDSYAPWVLAASPD